MASLLRAARLVSGKTGLLAGAGLVLGGAAAIGGGSVLASDDALHPGQYKWDHTGFLDAFDARQLRRGFQVYREVCASCHSLNRIAWRELVGVLADEATVKAWAADEDYIDAEPDSNGDPKERAGKLSDYLKPPYRNDEEARAMNGGALPPDLSLMIKARHDGENYVFSLLTGYKEAPEGVELREGLYYNPYFPGGAIGMEQQLNDGQVEYPDGTPATISQMAKDVTVFLSWAAEPTQDERKKLGFKVCLGLAVAVAASGLYKRWRWAPLKYRKISYR